LKCWGISSLVVLDEDSIKSAFRLVILLEFSPKSGRFHTHDGVTDGVVGRTTVEDFDPNQVLVELFSLALERTLSREPQEAAQARRMAEESAGQDPLELFPNALGRYRQRSKGSDHALDGRFHIAEGLRSRALSQWGARRKADVSKKDFNLPGRDPAPG
jgi:hypothetical protein